MSVTRLIALDDAPALAKLLQANRDFLAPWDPVHNDGYFTEAGEPRRSGARSASTGRGPSGRTSS